MDEGLTKIHDIFAGDNDFTDSTCLIESSLLELGEGGVSSPTVVKGNVLARKPWRLSATLYFSGQLEISSPSLLEV